MKKYYLISLGCPKNLVDSEVFADILQKNSYESCSQIQDADIILINTCGFIEDAKTEAIDTILEASRYTEGNAEKSLIVTGCFIKRYFEELQKQLPEVDYFVNLKDFAHFNEILQGKPFEFQRSYLTPNHYGYLRISDGCNNHCAYCAIPSIRGNLKSIPIEDLLLEAERMVQNGMKEIIVNAQDTTQYGIDLYGKQMLPELLIRLSKIEGLRWLRLLYLHPAHISEELIDVIQSLDNVCNYFEIPLQHISDKILQKMNRHTDSLHIKKILKMIKSKIPSAYIRTTFIVGFPGETEDDFEQLVDFVKEQRFIRMGAFGYSKEENTPAVKLKPQVPQRIIEKRKDTLMAIQQEISEDILQSFVGKTLEVIIDKESDWEDFVFEGRSQADAPEIDGIVYITQGQAEIGDIVKVVIDDSWEYDLVGKIID